MLISNPIYYICIKIRPPRTQIRLQRASRGVFRDRRPELYYPISSLDGHTQHKGAASRCQAAEPLRLLPPMETPKSRGYVLGQVPGVVSIRLLVAA